MPNNDRFPPSKPLSDLVYEQLQEIIEEEVEDTLLDRSKQIWNKLFKYNIFAGCTIFWVWVLSRIVNDILNLC